MSFVYQTLFPYARMHLKQFFEEHGKDDGLRRDLEQLVEENQTEKAVSAPAISERLSRA
jgi:methionine salvage enolase-phosphatase E1